MARPILRGSSFFSGEIPVSRRGALAAVAVAGLGSSTQVRPARAAAAKVETKTGFVPPDAAQRRAAAGPMNGLSPRSVRAFEPTDQFDPLPAPAPGEWLAEHSETGQTFSQFVAARPNRPDARRSRIYFLPLGDFDPEWSPRMADLEACARAFFQCDVRSLDPLPLENADITSRVGAAGSRQYLTGDFLKLLRDKLPKDGYCVLGVTMQDLYPGPTWNYVFGQASLSERVGIHSFARYDPVFWKQKRTAAAQELLLVRSLGVLLHETCHMFGMQHCIYYRCLVNGSNSLEESDRQPLHLCPVCLRKLQHSVGFDPSSRDADLLKEYRRLNVTAEADWLERRLKFVRGE